MEAIGRSMAETRDDGGALFRDPPAVLRVIDAGTLTGTISASDAIAVVREAMERLAGGCIDAPPRWAMPVTDGGAMGLMPGADVERGCFGLKALSLFEPDVRGARSGHQGLMLLFDAKTGRPTAVIDAAALTGLRTAAASAVATDALARPDARSLAILGTGEQARWHVETMPLVRPFGEIRIWGHTAGAARRFVDAHGVYGPRMLVCDSVEEAVSGADVICTVTHSSEPILRGGWLRRGQHVNLIGASTAAAREVDDDAVARSHFFVDSKANALSQAGELIGAIRAGLVPGDHIRAEIGDVLAGRAAGRTGADAITVYKSLGHVAQDLAVAVAALRRVEAAGSAISIPWR